MNAIITRGVRIGDNVVIGAGSVVTKNIPANVVAVGNPCRVLRPIEEKDKEYTTVTPGEDEDVCEYCGITHSGFFDMITGFFHKISVFFSKMFGC